MTLESVISMLTIRGVAGMEMTVRARLLIYQNVIYLLHPKIYLEMVTVIHRSTIWNVVLTEETVPLLALVTLR